MGYTLEIGEATMEYNESYVRIGCETVRLDNAPAYGEPTDYTNARWPSYSAWGDTIRKLELTDVMFNTRNGGAGSFVRNEKYYYPLMPSHPGEGPITLAHVEEVEEKLAAYKAKYPDHIAKYPPPKPDAKPLAGNIYADEDLVDDPRFDPVLCRGEWLVFWLRWAIENCKQPVFVNQ